MAYGKDDFIDFGDLDLDFLLGDYTCSEIDSDEEVDSKASYVNNKKRETKHYSCDQCSKRYCTISGLRGHLRTKHGISKIKASDYRTKSRDEIIPKHTPFHINKEDFKPFFKETLLDSLDDLKNNKLRRTSSVHGKSIINLTETIICNSEAIELICDKLWPHFFQVFQAATVSASSNLNDAIFSNFYSLTVDDNLNNDLQRILTGVTKVANVRQFIGVLLHKIIRTAIKKRAGVYEIENENNQPLTENDQAVLFYISGYIIKSLLQRKVPKSNSEKVTALHDALNAALSQEESRKKSFLIKYSEWTKKASRGGLKIPSDTFFLLVREFEQCCRENINEKSITKESLNRTALTECIMDRFMVKYYGDMLFEGPYSSFMLESCVKLFLTIRGNAWTRKRRQEEKDDPNHSKALRKSLKEYNKIVKQ